jgi:predicted metalloprotease with PDZ domain
MDLRLRSRSKGKVSLDEVFRYLYQTYYQQGKGVPEDGIQAALETLSGESWQDFFDQHVNGTVPIAYEEFLAPLGLEAGLSNAGSGWDLLGISRGEMINQGYLVQRVKPGSDAFVAGLGKEDLILEMDGKPVTQLEPESYLERMKTGKTIRLRVLSNFEVKELKLEYQGRLAPQKYELRLQKTPKARAEELYKSWLSPQATN